MPLTRDTARPRSSRSASSPSPAGWRSGSVEKSVSANPAQALRPLPQRHDAGRRNRPGDLLRLMRPHQWVKNAFVFIGLLFGRAWAVPELVMGEQQADEDEGVLDP